MNAVWRWCSPACAISGTEAMPRGERAPWWLRGLVTWLSALALVTPAPAATPAADSMWPGQWQARELKANTASWMLWSVLPTPDSKQLLVGLGDQSLWLWDLERSRRLHRFTQGPGDVFPANLA